MNFEKERNSLIDISLEDDFLIDSCLDNLSLDLRLSVACESENELVGSLRHAKERKHACMKNAENLVGVEEQKTGDPIEREYISESRSDSLRKSLAWDHAFFTSPGFLELEELCLVNRGFKNPEVECGSQEHTRSKVCMERSSCHEQGVGVVTRQRTQCLLKPKLTSPTKVNASLECKKRLKSMHDFKQQLINSGRTVVKSPSVSKSQVVQKTTKRRESLKSTTTVGHTKVTTTVNAKKPPLKAVSTSNAASQRQGMTSSRRPVSSSVSSVSSSQTRFSLIPTSNSLDFTPYTSYTSDSRTTSLMKSQGIEGECLCEPSSPASGDIQSIVDIEALEVHQNDEQSHQSPFEKDNLGKHLLNQDAVKSSKPSSLRLPSQKIGFFDVVSGMPTSSNDHIQTKTRPKNTKPKQTPQPVLTTRIVPPSEIAPVSHDKHDSKISVQAHGKKMQHRLEEKENMFHPEDTVIELKIKSSPSSSSSKSVANGSSSSGKHPSKPKRSMQQTMVGSSGTRIPFSIKGSPLKRSVFF